LLIPAASFCVVQCGHITGLPNRYTTNNPCANRAPKAHLQELLVQDILRPRRAAAHLLWWLGQQGGAFGPDAAATPVDELAERLGLDVQVFHPATRRPGTLGYLEPDENLIFLQDGLPESTRRFTLAHEIGHVVLHRPGGVSALTGNAVLTAEADELMAILDECNHSDLDAPSDPLSATQETLRAGQAYSARAQRESEANAFAAALLLPPRTLLRHYLTLNREGDAPRRQRSITRTLARRFGVSEDVALRQLTALLLPDAADMQPQAISPVAPARRGEGSNGRLDQWQRAAAESETPALVVAGPGTGKTSTLVGRVLYLVRDRQVPAQAILALTFSNKAAREMRERLELALAPGGNALDDATGIFTVPTLPTVSTIHAFCGDLLRRYAPLVGLRPDFRLISETEGYFLLRRLAGDLALSHYQPLGAPGMYFPTLLAAVSRAKDELADPERYATVARQLLECAQSPEERLAGERAAEVATVYAAYQATLETHGDADFGDMIRLAVRLLREQPNVLADVRAQYRHVLVDEFQDINRAMGVFLRALAGDDGALWAVGDPDQAIYRFRGASPANLSRFTQDYPRAQLHTLRRNYRSLPPILAGAAAVASDFLDGGERTPLEAERGQTAEMLVTLAEAGDEAAELAGLANAIRTRAARGRSLSEQVILCRTRRHCQRVARALQDAGIATHTSTPLLEQDEIKDALAVLSLLTDSSGAGLLRSGSTRDHAFSRPEAQTVLDAARLLHLQPTMLLAQGLAEVEGISAAGRRGLAALAAVVAELRQAPDVATGLARYLFSLTHIAQRLLAAAAEGDERAKARSSYLAQLLTLARAFEDQHQAILGDVPRPATAERIGADWAGFLDYIRVATLLRQENGGAAEDVLASDRDGVRVLTVHGSKGLEFPVVYLPGLADRRFPMQRRGDFAPLPVGLGEDETLEARDPRAHMAEEACLFYVALTRARDELVVSRAERYGRMRYRPSGFFASLERRLREQVRREEWHEQAAQRADVDELASAASIIAYEPTPEANGAELLSVSAIETYTRCPRQYAYRYVYGLHPREPGMAALRRTLHSTLTALHERFTDQPAPQGADAEAREQVSLEEAMALFEQHWTSAQHDEAEEREEPEAPRIADERDASVSAQPAGSGPAADDPFREVYRRHGRQIIERAWEQLALPLTREADITARVPASGATALALFDQPVTVQVGERDVAITVDRVEFGGDMASSGSAMRRASTRTSEKSPGKAQGQPVRFVRHRLGRGAGAPDMRSLLYTLAAEQRGAAVPAQLYQHNLTTGELERVTLDRRKLTKLREELDAALDGLARGDYAPHPDPATCQSCPFLLICPA
jgi:superfamily I DNA/RNA helicase/Zn-dependent peptidase ImmA (M78 family)/CRISPR/Cas system-associated exonuclease Cas4 (RecB family)